MSLLNISRWQNTFRSRRRIADDQLQRWHNGLEQLELGSELDNLVSPDEWLLIKRLRLSTTLGEDHGEWQAGEHWRQALSQELREQLEHGSRDNVVHYRHRRDALGDMLYRAACQDVRRSWAWEQMGLLDSRPGTSWTSAQILERALAHLLAEPSAIWPVLTRLIMAEAATGALTMVIRQTAGGGLKALLAACPQTQPYQRRVEEPSTRPAPAHPRLNETPLVLALLQWANTHRGLTRPHMLDIIVLLAAAAHPADQGLSRCDEDQAGLIVLAASRALMDDYFHPQALRQERDDAERASEAAPTTPQQARSAELIRPAPPRLPQAGTLDAHISSSKPYTPAELEPASLDDALPAAPPLPSHQQQEGSQWGGLLFLLHLLPATAWLEELDALSATQELDADSARSLLWQLATSGLGVPASDAAVRAFCGGWQPHARQLNVQGQISLPAALTTLMGHLLERLHTLISERLAHAPDITLTSICRRDALIRFEPGWIEVHFSVDQADTRLRRVGLDLDPGWMPWLGCVMRFVYA